MSVEKELQNKLTELLECKTDLLKKIANLELEIKNIGTQLKEIKCNNDERKFQTSKYTLKKRKINHESLIWKKQLEMYIDLENIHWFLLI